MAFDLLASLMEDKLAEKDAATLQSFQQTLEETVIARFPDAPIALVHDMRQVRDLAQLQQLIVAVVRAADLDAFRRELAAALVG